MSALGACVEINEKGNTMDANLARELVDHETTVPLQDDDSKVYGFIGEFIAANYAHQTAHPEGGLFAATFAMQN